MRRKIAFAMAVCIFLACYAANAQKPEVSFHQGKAIKPEKTAEGYYQLTISPEPFTITFPGGELHICTGLTADVFTYATTGTDINADVKSCFFIYKFGAMDKDADYLFVGNDKPTALNEPHGAKAQGKQSKYTVSALFIDDTEKPLATFKEFYMAIWLDADKDQYIDKEELWRVKVIVE